MVCRWGERDEDGRGVLRRATASALPKGKPAPPSGGLLHRLTPSVRVGVVVWCHVVVALGLRAWGDHHVVELVVVGSVTAGR